MRPRMIKQSKADDKEFNEEKKKNMEYENNDEMIDAKIDVSEPNETLTKFTLPVFKTYKK